MDTLFKSLTTVALTVGLHLSTSGIAPAVAKPSTSSDIAVNGLSLTATKTATKVSEFQPIVQDDGGRKPEGGDDSDGGGRS